MDGSGGSSSAPTAAQNAAAVWAYAVRSLTVDPGAAAHLLTQAAIAAMPPEVADAILARNLAGGADGGRTVRDALRASRNKSAIVDGTLTIYQEDDSTPAWSASVSTEARDALQSIDPA